MVLARKVVQTGVAEPDNPLIQVEVSVNKMVTDSAERNKFKASALNSQSAMFSARTTELMLVRA